MTRICLIEDEIKVAEFIKKGLEEHSYLVDIVKHGLAGKNKVLENNYDIVILDVMLPDISGMDVCRLIRHENSSIPILMLTALGTIDDKVTGLKSGADDYLVKPFHFSELLARLEALMRRKHSQNKAKQYLVFEDLKLDTWERTAERAGKKITLTAKEYLLLELLMQSPKKLLSRQYIAEKVWSLDFDTGTNVIDVYINYLRNKIEKGFKRKLIHTVIGMGYILK